MGQRPRDQSPRRNRDTRRADPADVSTATLTGGTEPVRISQSHRGDNSSRQASQLKSRHRDASGKAPAQVVKRRRRPSILLGLLGACVSLAMILVVAVAGWTVWAVHKPIDPGNDFYEIEAGQNLSQFGRQLVRRNVIDETLSLRLWSRLTGAGSNIKLGRYQLGDEKRVVDILDKVDRGDVITQQIVFIEGHSFREFRQRLVDTPDIAQTLAGVSDAQVLERLGARHDHPEGLFFPDTYSYVAGTTDFEILQRAYDRMREKLDEAWQQRQPDIPIQTPYEALILASIVEKETGAAHERSQIAGVFVNRLRQGWRLQTDPTVIYGLGDEFDGNLTRKHLRTDTQYNTYTRAGLPPTPIANPGADALMAVAKPQATTAFFFVARGDGTHQFSDTLEQHNEAVDKYQRKKGGSE